MTTNPSRISIGELEQAVQSVDPAAILVPPRILRRVIKHDCEIGGIGLRVPHRKTYCIASDRLLSIVDSFELNLPPSEKMPPVAILLARPDPDQLLNTRAEQALVKMWRLLFHARVHLELEHGLASATLTDDAAAEIIGQLGPLPFAEVRSVLRHEEMLLPPLEDRAALVEFAATWLELRHFAPESIPAYFPGLGAAEQVDEILSNLLDIDYLLAASRPLGAPEETVWRAATDPLVEGAVAARAALRPDRLHRKLMRRASASARSGNVVRAALLQLRAASVTSPKMAETARADAFENLDALVRRLEVALGQDPSDHDEWRSVVTALATRATRGVWSAEARLLYDLQKVCLDHERGVFKLDLAGWVLSGGKAPLKRELKNQRELLICKHLAAAASRLNAVRIPADEARKLGRLLHEAQIHAEEHLRMRFRPVLADTLDAVGLKPANLPETVARKKLIEELLDRVTARGFLTMGDLRDAISSNNLKLADLANADELWQGDPLLRADRRLAEVLDGVYRRGEVYLRWPQRLSSLAFGTPAGRKFTRYVALPFGGAWMVLYALEHTLALCGVHSPADRHAELIITTPWTVLTFGLTLLGVLNFPEFRAVWINVFRILGAGFRRLFIDWPRWLREWPPMQAMLRSRAFYLIKQYALKPLLISFLLLVTLQIAFSIRANTMRFLGLFFSVNLLINSRLGRTVDEWFTDAMVRGWRHLRVRIFAAIYSAIMDFFQQFLDSVERGLYAVDEWLRFKSGDSARLTYLKAPLALLWSILTYVVRIIVNVCIEPNINPIKHFPIVTVAAKLIIPLSIIFFERVLPAGTLRVFMQTMTIILLPGVFGFVAWELKENWKLYVANRSRHLKPVAIGSHGETMLRLLRPGFHSGTVPKTYARLRRAHRKALWTGRYRSVRRHEHSLHHVADAIRSFMEREFIVLLDRSKRLGKYRVECGAISLATNRIVVELLCPEAGEQPLRVQFSYQAGWLVGEIETRGWLDHLQHAQSTAVIAALAGLFKLSGIELLREQIEARLARDPQNFQIVEQGLLLSRNGDLQGAALLPLRRRLANNKAEADLIQADRIDFVFAGQPLLWDDWTRAWSDRDSDYRLRIAETLHAEAPAKATTPVAPPLPYSDFADGIPPQEVDSRRPLADPFEPG